ncbi:MAG: hypothetical protein OJF58_003110 [Enhydrobacter sp.]|nr:MAG: hypothetical protein OJF58_003110 [Enhydrobacter sp.]
MIKQLHDLEDPSGFAFGMTRELGRTASVPRTVSSRAQRGIFSPQLEQS